MVLPILFICLEKVYQKDGLKTEKKKILSSRLLTTKLLFKSLKKYRSLSKVKHIICASAIGIYESSYYKIFGEESKWEPNTFLQQVVEKWENEIQKFKNIGLNITIFRIGLVLSRRAYN